ncbi:MAG TPA: DUF4239 domain-containing protein [Actinocrinis sp.]|nr:DUF4239 domain-containing protein [Actinocrinis sp.]
MSNLLVPVLIVFGAALLGMGSIMLKHRIFPPDPDTEPGEGVGEYIAMMVGVLYALVLGIVLVSVWESRDNAESSVRSEASSLNQVYILAQDIPAPAGPQIQQDVKAYASVVTGSEWDQMAAHEPLGDAGWQSLTKLTDAVEAYQPVTAVQQNVSAQALSQLSTVYDSRRSRNGESTDSLSPILWIGLILGGVLTVSFVFCFGVQRRGNHLAMVMGLTGLIGFLVVLVFDLNHPFSGSMGIDSGVFTQYFSNT